MFLPISNISMKNKLKKGLYSLLFLGLCSFSVRAQNTKGCKIVKDGTFKTKWDGHDYIIMRKGSFQRELYPFKKLNVSFAVKWIDDCTYTLTPNPDVYKAQPETPKGNIVTVKVIKITPKGYLQRSTSNKSDYVFTSEFERVK